MFGMMKLCDFRLAHQNHISIKVLAILFDGNFITNPEVFGLFWMVP